MEDTFRNIHGFSYSLHGYSLRKYFVNSFVGPDDLVGTSQAWILPSCGWGKDSSWTVNYNQVWLQRGGTEHGSVQDRDWAYSEGLSEASWDLGGLNPKDEEEMAGGTSLGIGNGTNSKCEGLEV